MCATDQVAILISDDNPRPWFPKSYSFALVEEAEPITFREAIQARDRKPSGEVICDCVYKISTRPGEWVDAWGSSTLSWAHTTAIWTVCDWMGVSNLLLVREREDGVVVSHLSVECLKSNR